MNVDEAMAEVETTIRRNPRLFSIHYYEVASVLANEVERLRAELAQFRKDWCDDDEAIKQQALRVLDAAKVEGDSVYVPRMGALAEMMADEMVKVCDELAVASEAVKSLGNSFDKLRDELAVAKAASVLPVEIQSVYVNKYLGSVVVFIGDEKGAVEFDAWLCDRVKERGEG